MKQLQRLTRRRIALVCILILISPFGCGERQAEQQVEDDERPTYGGTFRLAQIPPQILDPLFIDDIYESALVNQIFDGLLTFDVNLRPVPALAREWTISGDRLTYTFTVRRGVTFHNGRELTAQDVIFSLTRIFDPSISALGIVREYLGGISGADQYHAGMATRIGGLSAVDRYTVRMILDEPSHDVLTTLAMDNVKIVPQEEVTKAGAPTFAEHPIGTGPFRFGSWNKSGRIVLLANHSYFNGRPYLDSLIFNVPLEYNEEEQATYFVEGRLETVAVPVGQLSRFTDKGSYTIIKRPELGFEFIGFNLQHPLLRNLKVRQSISHAIDKKRLIELDPESFLPASGILPPGMPGFTPAIKTYPYDPEKAKQLLRDIDRQQGGRLDGLEYWGVGTDTFVVYENDEIVRENLADIGIDLNIRYEHWLDFDQRVADGNAPMFSMSLIADMPDPVSFLLSSFHSRSESNYFHYHNPSVDSILERATSELNEAERLRWCQVAERMIVADAPLVPLDHVINIYAFQPYVQGIEISPYGISDMSMEKIWLKRVEPAPEEAPRPSSATTNHP